MQSKRLQIPKKAAINHWVLALIENPGFDIDVATLV